MLSFNLLIAAITSVSFQSAPNPLAELQRCESISDKDHKLGCYQAESARLVQLYQSGQITISTVEDQRRLAEEHFGRRAAPPASESVAPLERLETTLSSSSVNGNGKRVYSLADGSIWEQTDQNPTRITPAAGSTAAVRRGALGSYFIKVGNSPEIRVRRVN